MFTTVTVTIQTRYSGFQTRPRTSSSFCISWLFTHNNIMFDDRKWIPQGNTSPPKSLRRHLGELIIRTLSPHANITYDDMLMMVLETGRGPYNSTEWEAVETSREWHSGNGCYNGRCKFWMNILFENEVGRPAAATLENPFQVLSPRITKKINSHTECIWLHIFSDDV